MKNLLKVVFPVLLCLTVSAVLAQKTAVKKTTNTKKVTASNKVTLKATPREFGAPTAVSQITDVSETSVAYPALKNLIEQYGVTIAYADNTFKPKETLKRGDFIVALNSAYVSIRRALSAASLDTTIINTYDINRGGAYLTEVAQVKDVPENSIYYPASKSLLERWGVAAPFTLGKTLNPSTAISEKEVNDILRTTMGYNAGVKTMASSITREKFAMELNAALIQKMQVVTDLINMKQAEQVQKDQEKKRMEIMMQQADQMRKDSIAKEIEQNKIAAEKREEEARKKLAEKNKNPN